MRAGYRTDRVDADGGDVKNQTGAVYDRAHVATKKAEREATDQFHGLPDEIQEEYRERWQAEVDRQAARELLKHDLRIQTMLSGVGLFLAVTVVWDVPTATTVPAAVLIGGLTGWLWHVTDAGRFVCLLSVIPGYLVLRGVGPGQNPFAMFFGVVAMAAFATLLGALREIRTGNVPPALLRRVRERRLAREQAGRPPVPPPASRITF
jgi:hypothetical protein